MSWFTLTRNFIDQDQHIQQKISKWSDIPVVNVLVCLNGFKKERNIEKSAAQRESRGVCAHVCVACMLLLLCR